MLTTSLLERIGKRTVLVDACVSPRIARALRKAGLSSVRHMNEINPMMPDAHIEYLVLEPTDVLITHDRMFARFLGPQKAILLQQDDVRKMISKHEDPFWSEGLRLSKAKSGMTLSSLFLLLFFFYLLKHSILKAFNGNQQHATTIIF